MFHTLQALSIAAIAIAIVLFFGKKLHKEKSLIAGLLLCLLLTAVISNKIVELIPLPTDSVIIAATGEKNEAASGNEAYLINYIVGGKEYEIRNATEGKWFWKGDVYMWRNENDSRQPEGTTRSITMQIPYGRDRSIQFGLSKWNGIVEVTYNGETQVYDLFKSGDKNSLYAPVPDTEAFALYGTKLLRMAAFLLIVAAIMACPVFCTVKYEYIAIKDFWGKHWDKLYYIGLAVLYVLLMQKNSVDGSFWGDEIWELGRKYPDIPYRYRHAIVYYLLTDIWFRLMPYGQEHLLLLPQLFVGITIYIAGIIGNRLKGKQLGIILSTLVASSLSIVYQCAMEYRVYAFMLFSTALMLYTFIKKTQHLGNETYWEIFVHSIAITLAMDMHAFSLAAAGLIMLADFILIIGRKASGKCLLEFILPGIYGIRWIIIFVLGYGIDQMATYASWMDPPDAERVVSTITWLMGSQNIMFAILILGIAIMLLGMLRKIAAAKYNFPVDYIESVILLVPLIIILIIYLYSSFVNPKHPLFFDRYFISIILFLFCIVAIAIDEIIDVIGKIEKKGYSKQYTSLFVVLILLVSFWTKVGSWEIFPAADHTRIMTYRQQADYLLSQNDIYCDSTFFLFDHNDEATVGYQYYLTHKDTRDIIQYDNSLPPDLDTYDVIYCSYAIERNKNKILSNEVWEAEGFVLQEDNTSVNILKFIRKE